MDLNGNKCEKKDEDHFDDSNVPNVRSLKIFFQNQPIIGFKPLNENRSESSSTHSNESKDMSIDSSDKVVVSRNNRLIPRPPKAIQSCDIKVSPFLKSLVSSECERNVESISSVPPIPKPRKSLQKYKSVEYSDQKCNFEPKSSVRPIDDLKNISDSGLRSNSLIESLTKEFRELNANERKDRTSSHNFLPKTYQMIDCHTFDPKAETNNQTFVANSETSVKLTKNVNKTKKPFKSFLKRSKLLSIRRFSDNSEKQRKKCQTIDVNTNPNELMRPIKPTRKPPEPPKLNFRPPAPLPPPEPNEDYYEDTLTMNAEIRLNTGYELYSDSVDSEGIYSTLDNDYDDQNDSDIYEGIDDYDDGLTHRSDHTYICDNYYEDNSIDDFSDCEGIYEVLPFERDDQSIVSNGSTISLDDNQSEANSDFNAKDMKKCEQKFDRKRNLKAIKLKKKFNLNGNEIPVNAGIVKEDSKGSRYDLFVQKGETVLILRMEDNPPGKWLAKNERSKIGFVDLDNISFDAESVKCIINTLVAHESPQ